MTVPELRLLLFGRLGSELESERLWSIGRVTLRPEAVVGEAEADPVGVELERGTVGLREREVRMLLSMVPIVGERDP